jgi:hypothetical protein
MSLRATILSLAEPSSSETSTLEGIGSAFSSALDSRSPVAIALIAVIVVVLGIAGLRWHRDAGRVAKAEAEADVEREARRQAVIAELAARREQRQWVRVPAHLRLELAELDAHEHLRVREFETLNISGGGLAFLSHDPFPTGALLELKLDLGEGRPLAVPGVIRRTEPGPDAESASLVVLSFGAIDNASRERIIRWVAKEVVREIAEANRGRVCSVCGRPLADTSTSSAHFTCLAQAERAKAAEAKAAKDKAAKAVA